MTTDTDAASIHSLHSQLRENIVMHLFVGDLLRLLWRNGVFDAEVLQAEFDSAGYDLVLSRGHVTRHIQLKAVRLGGARRDVSVSLKLQDKPSGCVLWLTVDDSLNIVGYDFFGAEPGAPLPRINVLKPTKHTKADSSGTKNERPEHRLVPRTRFKKLAGTNEVLSHLLG